MKFFNRLTSGTSSHPQSAHNPSGIPRISAGLLGYENMLKTMQPRLYRTWHIEPWQKPSDLATYGRILICPHAIVTRKSLTNLLSGVFLLEDLIADNNGYVRTLCECTNLYHIDRERARPAPPAPTVLPLAADLFPHQANNNDHARPP